MSKTKFETLSWNQCFSLIDHYQPSDSTICSVLGISPDELQTARQMRSVGKFTPSANVDIERYKNLFETASVHTRPSADSTSETVTSTPRVKVAKKRGRKGNKILTAFAAVPTVPVPAEAFSVNQKVGLSSLRQAKRYGQPNVHVKMKNGTLMIWRDAN